MDSNAVIAILLTTISGLSTGLGGVIIVALGTPSFVKLGHMLSFSAGVMVYISFVDLLVGAISSVGFLAANVAFFAGAAVFLIVVAVIPEPDVSYLIEPSKPTTVAPAAATAAKTRPRKGSLSAPAPKVVVREDAKSLMILGLITAVGISMHNFPEGIAVFLSCLGRGPAVGLPLTLAIAAHNIPEGMAVAAPVYSATGSRWKAIKYSVLSGVCEPLGALAVAAVLGPLMTAWLVQVLLAAVAGIMVVMSFRELMPATFKYVDSERASISFLAGMIAIFFTVHYLHQFLDA